MSAVSIDPEKAAFHPPAPPHPTPPLDPTPTLNPPPLTPKPLNPVVQALQGVCRIKLQDWLSVRMAPHPAVRLAKSWRLPGLGMVVRAR